MMIPLIAVIVAVVTDGLGVLPVVVAVKTTCPEPFGMGFWLKLAVVPAGNPETLRVTGALKPPVGVIAMAYWAVWPWAMFRIVGVMVPPKSPTELFTVRGRLVV